MARRGKASSDPLKALGDMANVLEGRAYLDDTTANQRRAMREAADVVRGAIETYGQELNPHLLLAFFTGAVAQAHVAAETNPVASILGRALGQAESSKSPHLTLSISIAYLARDLLAGERVE